MRSGKEVVGAAMIVPDGACESSFSTSALRVTCRWYWPRYVDCAAQLCHQSIASFNFSSIAVPSGGTTAGASAEKLNVKTTDSPDSNTKCAAKPSGVGSSPTSPRRMKTFASVSIRHPNLPHLLIVEPTHQQP